MQPLYLDRVELDRCFRCAATWFDPDELVRVSGVQRTPEMTRTQPACRCPACGEHLWFARLHTCEVLTCVGCGGSFVTDAQLERAAMGRLTGRVPRAMQFICVGCKDRYTLADSTRVKSGLACARCAERLPPAPQDLPPRRAERPHPGASPATTNSQGEGRWMELLGDLFDLLT